MPDPISITTRRWRLARSLEIALNSEPLDLENVRLRLSLLMAVLNHESTSPPATTSTTPTTRRRRFVSIARFLDRDGTEVLDAICEEGRHWCRVPSIGGGWDVHPDLPEIAE
jgi:hypothetical protein